MGRHSKPVPVPADERLCDTCNSVEDEYHHLIQCTKYNINRISLYEVASEHIVNFNGLNDSEKFISLLTSENKVMLSCVANFLLNAD